MFVANEALPNTLAVEVREITDLTGHASVKAWVPSESVQAGRRSASGHEKDPSLMPLTTDQCSGLGATQACEVTSHKCRGSAFMNEW